MTGKWSDYQLPRAPGPARYPFKEDAPGTGPTPRKSTDKRQRFVSSDPGVRIPVSDAQIAQIVALREELYPHGSAPTFIAPLSQLQVTQQLAELNRKILYKKMGI